MFKWWNFGCDDDIEVDKKHQEIIDNIDYISKQIPNVSLHLSTKIDCLIRQINNLEEKIDEMQKSIINLKKKKKDK